MIEIGERLKKAREASGMSLEEIEEITKIRKKYLLALEEGNFSVISEEVYLKGFIKNYAECVGLDGNAVVREYNELCKIRDAMKMEEIKDERSKKANVAEVEDENGDPGIIRWVIIILVIILIAVIITSILIK